MNNSYQVITIFSLLSKKSVEQIPSFYSEKKKFSFTTEKSSIVKVEDITKANK